MAAPAIADRVKAQLEGDYPAGKLGWTDQVSWSGPQSVPLTQIDRTAGQADWDAAAANKAKVQTFRKRLAAGGWWKAAVVLRLPGKPRLFVVDGHTRIIAATALGMPVQAYVGTAKTVTGPWSSLHSQQLANDAEAVELSAQTPVLSTVHHPFGSPAGPGLFRVKGLELPAYIQNIAHALVRNGHDESSAIQLAIGAVQRWARSQGKVSPEVRAAAAKALAAWEAAKATAHSHANEGGDAVELAAPSLGEIALAFSEALHPRVPAGGAGGGEFGSKAAGPAKQAPAKSQQAKQQKPGIGAGRKAALAKQAASLHARAKADRMQAAELESQLQTLNAAIKVKIQASAKAKTAAKSAAAKAGTAKKAAKVTKATNKARAGKKATSKKASLPHMRVRRIVLRSKIHDLRSQARALDKQAASIKLAGDDGGFLELAFAEALAERVPSGKREGGQFHARTSLTRHDTPDERARAVNAMDERQRAAVRVSTLPPPGYSWDRADRLTVAAP